MGRKIKTMFAKIKDGYNNLRRHKIMVMIILVLGYACWYMFTQNYTFQMPVVSKQFGKSYTSVSNDLVQCNNDLDFANSKLKEFNDKAREEIK